MGSKGSQPTATPTLPAPPAGMGRDDTGTLRPLSEIRTFGQPQPAAPMVSPSVLLPEAAPQPAAPAMVQPSGPNVFKQAQQYQTQAGDIYGRLGSFSPTDMQAAQIGPAQTMESVGAVSAAQAPDQIQVGQLASTNLGSYMSPYQQQVIEAGQADIERQRQLASENLAAQAQRAGAFGGSRQAVQEGVLAGEALRQSGALSAQQRQQAFESALQSGRFDIGQTQAARTMASQQQFQASQLGQQAREAAAAREQAARAGNMQAANQFAQQQAQLEQAARQANFQGQFQAAGIQQAAAGGLGGLGQQLFGQGMGVQQQIGQQAAFQRSLQQKLLDLQKQQFGQATGAPLSGLGAMSQIMAQTPYSTTSTSQTSTPFNPATLLFI